LIGKLKLEENPDETGISWKMLVDGMAEENREEWRCFRWS
jgi:hypothetical protein